MLTLYTKPGCEYCEKVKEDAAALGIALNEKSAADPGIVEEIVEKGGKKQVPFLVDDESKVSLYGSDEIIAHLHARFR